MTVEPCLSCFCISADSSGTNIITYTVNFFDWSMLTSSPYELTNDSIESLLCIVSKKYIRLRYSLVNWKRWRFQTYWSLYLAAICSYRCPCKVFDSLVEMSYLTKCVHPRNFRNYVSKLDNDMYVFVK